MEAFDGKPIVRTLSGTLVVHEHAADIQLERGHILE